jgi:fatty-acyl-CoA synthase
VSTAVSYWAGPTDIALIDTTIGERLRSVATADPGREALVVRHQNVRLTYAELDARVDEVARALLSAGLGVGDRVGIWSPNNLEWTLTQFATARIGVILVTLNPAYRTSEVEYALRQSGVRLLVAASSFKASDYRAMVRLGPQLSRPQTRSTCNTHRGQLGSQRAQRSPTATS